MPPRADAARAVPAPLGPPARGWLAPALLLTALIVGLRILALWFNRTDLFVDEAQYWLWGQSPDFGYYSKPPMIAWVIRAFGSACGDLAFCIRLPAPLFHGVTALILGAIAARMAGRRGALLVVTGYLTLPMVALGSLLVSTDTIMFPFLAAALWAWLACLSGAGAGVALVGGLALGLAFLSKYAAVYYILCALLAAGMRPRLSPVQAGIFLLGFTAGAAPNIVWNLLNGLSTAQHTLDNADWLREPSARAALNLSGLLEFLAAQFAVFGPVLFVGLTILAATWRRRPPEVRRLLLFALPILAVVCVQALVSRAYANWAAAAYLAGTLAVLPWLGRVSRAWLGVSFAINLALCVALPVFTLAPALVTVAGQSPVERYLGRNELSLAILNAARMQGVGTVVSNNRDILADLFHTGRNSDLAFRAVPSPGRPGNHYQQRYPATGAEGAALYVGLGATPPCAGAVSLGAMRPLHGGWRGKTIGFWRLDSACLTL